MALPDPTPPVMESVLALTGQVSVKHEWVGQHVRSAHSKCGIKSNAKEYPCLRYATHIAGALTNQGSKIGH